MPFVSTAMYFCKPTSLESTPALALNFITYFLHSGIPYEYSNESVVWMVNNLVPINVDMSFLSVI